MNLNGVNSKLFLDSADPEQTKIVKSKLGRLDGQTTNPSLTIKNPAIKDLLGDREKIGRDELLNFYRETVEKISNLIPDGSVSIEVYADSNTTANEMFTQAKEMNSWIPNAHIKFPIVHEGLVAAEKAVGEGMRVNMTLCFTQAQAAAVYSATKGAKKGDVFVSPFIGRLDDRGENGMDLIKNILKMYKSGDGHVEVLTASVRNLNHFKQAITLGSDIITAPQEIYTTLTDGDISNLKNFKYNDSELLSILYIDLDLDEKFENIEIGHDLTDKGLEKFASDWNSVISP